MRKPISKKLRFDVFKRDSFTCQYCGRSAPEVVLHVDHIKPVADGGKNSILNLITSCADCNLGKGARALSDNSTVMKQKAQLDELSERREQLDLMLKWKEGLQSIAKMEVDAVKKYLASEGWGLSEAGEKSVMRLIKKYGYSETVIGIEISIEKGVSDLIGYADRVCAMRLKQTLDPLLKDKMYIRGILKNKMSPYEFNRRQSELLDFLDRFCLTEEDVVNIKKIAVTVDGWHLFWLSINQIYGY